MRAARPTDRATLLPGARLAPDGLTRCVDCQAVIPDDVPREARTYVFETRNGRRRAIGEACAACAEKARELEQ